MLQFYLTLAETDDDKIKFERLYNRYKGLMLSCAYDILRDSDLAEDAVHNAFLRVLKNLSKVGELDSPHTRSFLVIITENVSKSMYSQRKRRSTIPLEEAYSCHDVGETPESSLNAKILAEKIAALPEIYSRVMLLKYLNDLSDKEIASALAISQPAVRKRLQRARELLKISLEE